LAIVIQANTEKKEMIAERVVSRDTSMVLSVLWGFTGLDRLFMGCYVTGAIKFLLFAIYFALGPEGVFKVKNNPIEVKLVVGLVVGVWYITDVLRLLWGGVNISSNRQFCDGYVWRDTDNTPRYAVVLSLLLWIGIFHFLY
jgi:hypothetical protein